MAYNQRVKCLRFLPMLLLLASPAAAEVKSFEVFSFGKREIHAIQGGWYPVFVRFEYAGPEGEGEVEIVNSRQASSWISPIKLAKLTRRQVTIYCYQRNRPTADDRLTVRLKRGKTTLAEKKFELVPLDGKHHRVLLLGHPNLQNFADARRLPSQATVIHHPADSPLPDRSEGYDAFQQILTCRYPLDRLSTAQQQALREWISNGGELIFSANSADADKPLGAFASSLLPVRDRKLAQDDLQVAWRMLDETPAKKTAPFRITTGTLTGEALLWNAEGQPIVAHHSLGLGRVVFCGYDLSRPPMIYWSARERFLLHITNPPTAFEPTGELAEPIRKYLERTGKSGFLGWIAIYLGCYLLMLTAGSWFLVRKLERSPKVLLVLPSIVLVFALSAPVLARLLLNRGTHWQSLTIRYQRSDATLASEWTYFMAYAPGRVKTRIQFRQNDLVSHPPLDEDHLGFHSRSVQGTQTYLDQVTLYLTGKNYMLARRLRQAAPIRATLKIKTDSETVSGEVGGGLEKFTQAFCVLGQTAGTVSWNRSKPGSFSARLNSTPEKSLRLLLKTLDDWKVDHHTNPKHPWQLALPVSSQYCGYLVFLEKTEPLLRPLVNWSSHRHYRLWIVQIPLSLPQEKDGTTIPLGLVRSEVMRAVQRGDDEKKPRYSVYQQAFTLPPQTRSARSIDLRFDWQVHRDHEKAQVVFELYNPRTGDWDAQSTRRPSLISTGKIYLDSRGKVLTRLRLVEPNDQAKGKGEGPGFRISRPPELELVRTHR